MLMDWETEYSKKTTDLLQFTDKLFHVMMYSVSYWWRQPGYLQKSIVPAQVSEQFKLGHMNLYQVHLDIRGNQQL